MYRYQATFPLIASIHLVAIESGKCSMLKEFLISFLSRAITPLYDFFFGRLIDALIPRQPLARLNPSFVHKRS